MRYRVVSVQEDDGRESIMVYAADREEALSLVSGVFSSAPVLLGEIDGQCHN